MLGNRGYARLVAEDDEMVIYEYKAIQLGCPEACQFEMVKPGYFFIKKSGFKEPEIHSKIRRRPKSGRKYLDVKRIPVSVNYGQLIEDGDLVIEEGTTYWRDSCYSDKYVMNHLLVDIFQDYQIYGEIPIYISMGN